MNLSDLFNLKSTGGRYLVYLLGQYDKLVIANYVYLFTTRDSKLRVILDDEFNKVKNGVDDAMLEIDGLVNTLDLDNLDNQEESMEQIANLIESLSSYLSYIKNTLESKENDGI